jgi:anti-anti-sigma factor
MPPLKFFRVDRDGNTLIAVTLRDITSLSDEHLEEELEDLQRQLEQPDVKNLVMDFGQVSYLESCTLNTMVSLWKRVRLCNGKMALCNVSSLAREILTITKFDTIWPILASRDEALTSVRT